MAPEESPTVRILARLLVVAVAFLVAPMAVAQDVVTTGPPPEIRALVDAFTGAVLGNSPDAWETMTRERCAPEFLTKNSVAERRKLYDTLHGAVAGGKRGRVMRRGPDEPLELQMIGPSGQPAGTIVLEVTSGTPPKITSISRKGRDGHALTRRLARAQVDAVERDVPVRDEQLEPALLLFLQLRPIRIELGDNLLFGR